MPIPKIGFHITTPQDETDYPYGSSDLPSDLPSDGPAPGFPIFLSSAGSLDPEGAPVTFFWNVQDPMGRYLTLDPDPGAARPSFTPATIGPHTIVLEVIETGGLVQIGLTTLILQVTPRPCARDGVSPPCSDQLAVSGGTFVAGSGDLTGEANERPPHSTAVAPYMLDKYEVTVGRFRKFLATYSGQSPTDGAGAHPLIPGSGWRTEAWKMTLPSSPEQFSFAISECGGTWTDQRGPSEAHPVTCVTWYEAFAFCASEGKRLPTQAEWEYAAAGGDEQRAYPWGDEAPSIERAIFGCLFDGNPTCAKADLPPVGSRIKGAGRWGHLDLAGSVWEWTFDAYALYTDAVCDNCAVVTPEAGDGRVFRGGDFQFDDVSSLRAAARLAFTAGFPAETRGFRCAQSSATLNQ